MSIYQLKAYDCKKTDLENVIDLKTSKQFKTIIFVPYFFNNVK